MARNPVRLIATLTLVMGVGVWPSCFPGARRITDSSSLQQKGSISIDGVRSAIIGRSQFLPDEASYLIVDRCALAKVFSSEQIDSLTARLAAMQHSTRFSGCGFSVVAERETVYWHLRTLEDRRATQVVTADVSRRGYNAFHKETSTIRRRHGDDSYLAELTLSMVGFFD